MKPKLLFFQVGCSKNLADFILLHRQQHVKCLAEFFEVITINEDCDYQQVCDIYQPDLALFESGVNYRACHRIEIKNTHTHSDIPKIGLHNGDPWCEARAGFLSDMDRWGIETFFSIGITTSEHTPGIAESLFVWPNFVDADVYRDYSESKIIPVLLTGGTWPLYPWRQKIYKLLAQYFPSLTSPHNGYQKKTNSQMIYGEKYARTMNASLFVPTCGTLAKEIVRKHFEIPASRACLITEKSASLEAAGFADMQNCVFVDEYNVLEKINHLLQNLDELEQITNNGYQFVHSLHTLKQRDQIFQWFNLHKTLRSSQKIVQANPFEPLTVVEKSSGVQNSYITCKGLDIILLRQGDQQLWIGEYEKAEVLYLKCHNHIPWMPEPKLRLALCNLYKGCADTALEWILQPLRYTLEEYKAHDPDPVEWAYFIISLLCIGKIDEAIKRADQFVWLNHFELNYTRWIICILKNERNIMPLPHDSRSGNRCSIHQLPVRSLQEWIEHICLMLRACQQFDLAETIVKQTSPEVPPFQQQASVASIESLENKRNLIYNKTIKSSPLLPTKSRLYSFSNQLISQMREGLKLKTRLLYFLNYLEFKFGYFLPYHLSEARNDAFFHAIQILTREEEIATALIIGASFNERVSSAFLMGANESSTRSTVFCINTLKPSFIKLQKIYGNNHITKCYGLSSSTAEEIFDELESKLKIIKQENDFEFFDAVLIDGSELTLGTELSAELYGSRFLVLDDISTLKNYMNYNKLIADHDYVLIEHNPTLRGGYAIFKYIPTEILLEDV